jgi:hypothetical protein
MMVSEAEQVLNDVLNSTSELKELLAFSAEQQTAVRLLYSVRLYALMDHLLSPTIGITTSFFFAGISKEPYFCTSHIKDIN